GSATVAGDRVTTPFTATRPAKTSSSPPRREVSPAWARILFSLSFAMPGSALALRRRVPRPRALSCPVLGVRLGRPGGRLREVGKDQLTLDLRQVVEVSQPERDQELARGLEEERPSRRLLAACDADEAPLQQVVEHALGVHAAHGVDLGPGYGLPV